MQLQTYTPQFPKPASFNTLQAMDIIIELEASLFNCNAVAFIGIKHAIKTNSYPAIEIIKTVKDMIVDNEAGVACMIGNKLTDKIKNFNP